MNIAHVALWTRSLDAQVQFWETVFGGRSNDRYVSKNRPGFKSHFITLDDGQCTFAPGICRLGAYRHQRRQQSAGGQYGSAGAGKRLPAQRPAYDRGRFL